MSSDEALRISAGQCSSVSEDTDSGVGNSRQAGV